MRDANITWLTDSIATGGDLSFNPDIMVHQFGQLQEMGIALVIDCRIEANDKILWQAVKSTDYLHLPVDDVYGGHLPVEHFDRAVLAARDVLATGGKVFAHCHMGINRGPSTAMAILMDRGMTPTDAFDLIREKRPQAGIAFAEDAVYAQHLREGWSVAEAKELTRFFKRHMDAVFGPAEQAQVQHILRSHHQMDREEYMQA